MARLTLTPEELREITGRVRASAQRRALNHLGIDVRGVRPDGSLVVLRSSVEGHGGGQRQPQRPGPDFGALNDVA